MKIGILITWCVIVFAGLFVFVIMISTQEPKEEITWEEITQMTREEFGKDQRLSSMSRASVAWILVQRIKELETHISHPVGRE